MSVARQATKWNLSLSEVERTQLLILLERELRDTHVESRRTESPDFREDVHEHEAVLQNLIEKLRPR